ncbi:MAG TPA: archease [Candidatus Dormibacteraeota bacterium]|nr:archease [Candidatus Dormibacteraeota bacterium]
MTMAHVELIAGGPPPGVTFREHTADVILEATGPTLESCLARAGAGLFAVFAPPPTGEPLSTQEIRVEAPSVEELLVAWLEELLYRSEVGGMVFSRFEVEVGPGAGPTLALVGRVGGRRLRPEDELVGPAVKAVTRHELRLGPGGEGWLAHVVLDV